MIKGIGTDILEIERFKKVLDKHPKRFVDRIFTKQEYQYCEKYKDMLSHLAARFSAKEAIAKCLGTGFGEKLSFKDILIDRNDKGKPTVKLSEKAQKHFGTPNIELSMSHCQKYVTATAIWF